MKLPKPGQIFERKYKLQEIIGRGGFAAVYRATDIELGRDVAIKVLAPDEQGYSTELTSRFLREARVIGSFQDPHTITMFEFGRADGLLYMVFEYVRGKPLNEVIADRGTIAPQDAVHILEQVLYSLREAHAAGVFHRDIKPANILIHDYMGDPNRVKLLDFGIAKTVSTDVGGNITREGVSLGTPRYMAPEQLVGGQISAASDLYSLGLVGHEMLAGRPAIGGSDSKATIRNQLSDVALRVPCADPASAAVCRLVDRLTSRAPEARYQSADDVLNALRALDQAETEPLPPIPQDPGHNLPPAVTKPADDHEISLATVLLVGLGAAAVVTCILTVFSVSRARDELAPQPPRFVLPPVVSSPARQLPTAAVDELAPVVSAPDTGVDASANEELGSGCGQEAAWSGEKFLQWQDGLERNNWLTYLPAGYDENRRYPVVIMFHKATKDAKTFLANTGFMKLADRRKFIIIAPDGAGSTSPWSSDTPKFVQAALDATAKLVCLDRSRVYTVGHGGGGQMARELPCSMPISAVAVAGSGVATEEPVCRAHPPVPLIHFQGKHDRYVPLDGGQSCTGGLFRSLEEVEQLWKDRNQCRGKGRKYARKKTGVCTTWRCEASFVSCVVDGGHDWPGAKPEFLELPGCPVPAPTYPFGEEIWRFFRNNGADLNVE